MVTRAFQLFVEGKGVANEAQKKALLLHYAGLQVKIYVFRFTAYSTTR